MCKPVLSLRLVVPQLPGLGVVQIDTGGAASSIPTLIAQLRLIEQMTKGEDGCQVLGNIVKNIAAIGGGTGQNGNGISVARYAELFRMLLEDTRAARPQCRIVLGEPFALPGGEFKPEWRSELHQRGEVVRQLAAEYGAAFVPYQAMFDAAQARYTAAELAADGVHPSPLGHQLMVKAWREAARL